MKKLKLFSIIAMALALAGVSNAADEEIIGKYGAITVKKVLVNEPYRDDVKTEVIVAVIDDDSKETPVITEDIQVDSVYYNRVFKAQVPSTLMLPFDLKQADWKMAGFNLFEFVKITKNTSDCRSNDCGSRYVVQAKESYSRSLKANTPYIAVPYKDIDVSFHMRYAQPEHVYLNTTTNERRVSRVYEEYNWELIGTYESIKFTKPKGIYGFAGKSSDDTNIGDFKKAACNETSCASIRPFRAYLRCTLAEQPSAVKGLAKTAEVASLDNLPSTIEVQIIKDDSTTTYLGTLDTRTGEFIKEDNRWFDMKGRLLQHKPTAKGTYFNNRKKVVIK